MRPHAIQLFVTEAFTQGNTGDFVVKNKRQNVLGTSSLIKWMFVQTDRRSVQVLLGEIRATVECFVAKEEASVIDTSLKDV